VLSERVREMIESLDAIVWSVNPANDSLDQLATYLSEYFQQLFSRSGIRCRLDVADDLPAYPMTPDERSNLFLTAKEAMHNILKHSGATEARLELRMTDRRFCLVLADNGHGFDPAAVSRRRNGLVNMRSRVAELKGELRIESIAGEGTKLIIIIPFDRALSHSCLPLSPSLKTTRP
jgi:signal transduction histidine kinase